MTTSGCFYVSLDHPRPLESVWKSIIHTKMPKRKMKLPHNNAIIMRWVHIQCLEQPFTNLDTNIFEGSPRYLISEAIRHPKQTMYAQPLNCFVCSIFDFSLAMQCQKCQHHFLVYYAHISWVVIFFTQVYSRQISKGFTRAFTSYQAHKLICGDGWQTHSTTISLDFWEREKNHCRYLKHV